MKESQSRSYPEQQTKTIALRKNRGISWTSTRPYILPCNSLRHLAGVQTRRDGIILSFYDLCHRKKNLRNCSQSHCFVNLTPSTLCRSRCCPRRGCLKRPCHGCLVIILFIKSTPIVADTFGTAV